jgi:hypothetical protein
VESVRSKQYTGAGSPGDGVGPLRERTVVSPEVKSRRLRKRRGPGPMRLEPRPTLEEDKDAAFLRMRARAKLTKNKRVETKRFDRER